MPFRFDHTLFCPSCPFGVCVEDRRTNPVPGRKTRFRLKQSTAVHCTFEKFAPGGHFDPAPQRTYDEYLAQFRHNAIEAGRTLIGNQFDLSAQALAKVEGDVFELLEAAALWNACASWNEFMDTGTWHSHAFKKPHGAIPTSYRKIAAVWLPRGYDTTKLFKPDVRNRVRAFEHALELREMELGLSAPDLVGVRLPSDLSPQLQPLRHPLDNLDEQNHYLLEHMYKNLEGTLSGSDFLFAVAVKRTTRSDRLYQPLFEANVLKYLIESVLAGSAFRFYVHMGSMAGADVSGRYRAASLVSLLRGGSEFSRAVNSSYHAERPISAAQSVLDDFTLFPI